MESRGITSKGAAAAEADSTSSSASGGSRPERPAEASYRPAQRNSTMLLIAYIRIHDDWDTMPTTIPPAPVHSEGVTTSQLILLGLLRFEEFVRVWADLSLSKNSSPQSGAFIQTTGTPSAGNGSAIFRGRQSTARLAPWSVQIGESRVELKMANHLHRPHMLIVVERFPTSQLVAAGQSALSSLPKKGCVRCTRQTNTG
jgi:hypothetical protein